LDQGAAAEIDLGDGFRGGRRPWENAMVPWRIKNIQNPMTLVTLEHLKVLVEKKNGCNIILVLADGVLRTFSY
jgi:hypothetical protein